MEHRRINGFFFPVGTERRISITSSNTSKLLKYIKHAYEQQIGYKVKIMLARRGYCLYKGFSSLS
jgi:ABC-type tungstate transport system permease subunit